MWCSRCHLSLCLSLHPSACHTRVLCKNCQKSVTTYWNVFYCQKEVTYSKKCLGLMLCTKVLALMITSEKTHMERTVWTTKLNMSHQRPPLNWLSPNLVNGCLLHVTLCDRFWSLESVCIDDMTRQGGDISDCVTYDMIRCDKRV